MDICKKSPFVRDGKKFRFCRKCLSKLIRPTFKGLCKDCSKKRSGGDYDTTLY